MSETLTPQQKLAVEDRGGNLLVSAAAGSGKTKVLVDRLMSYLTDPVAPQNIDAFLMITYTKAAAAELRAKIASKLSKAIASSPENKHLRRQMQRLYLAKISTVHSFCGDILKEYAYLLDVAADFRVADENECVQLQELAMDHVLNELYEQSEPDSDFLALIDSQGLGRDDRQVPKLVLNVYRKAKCHLDFEGWLDSSVASCDVSSISDLSQTIWGKYLIDDLKAYLQLQIHAMAKCVQAANAEPDMQKPVALLDDTLTQLQQLYACNTWDEIWLHRDISYGTLSFSKKCQNIDLIDQIKAVRDACKEGLKKRLRRFNGSSQQLLADISSTEAATKGLIHLVRLFDKEYSRLKRNCRILDFSDLEHRTLDLLWGSTRSGITQIAKEIGKRYCQIMVDEYQDSNAVQDAIFQALSSQRHNCFMVGDVKQSIYQFRLADPGIFLDKYNRYALAPDVSDGLGRKVMLSSNFRSGGAVVEAVNDVFFDCMYENVGGLRYTEAEALMEGIPHVALPDTEIELHGISVESDTYTEEAAFVAARISTLLSEKTPVRDGENIRPVRPEDIVILLRSPGSVGRHFQSALESLGISCSFDNGIELMEAEEIQFIHALLQVISNPLQDIPLIATLSSRVFGFTADELAGIRTDAMGVDFYHALLLNNNQKTRQYLEILDQLRLDARMYSVPELIDRIYMLTDADVIYQSVENGDIRMDNLRTFCALASNYASLGQGNLEGFLDYLQIIISEGYQIPGTASCDAVRIMSIHKSKGLEFPVVFLCGLSKSFNMEQTREQILCDSELGLGLSCVDIQRRLRYPTVAKHAISAKMYAQAISEELRVLYVAMTRPKDRLIMTYASSSLDRELKEISARMDISDPVLLSCDVGSAGEWVLLAALRHSEAFSFHNVARKPDQVRILQFPWAITLQENPVSEIMTEAKEENFEPVTDACLERMRIGLSYVYPYYDATTTPSKITATQLKGRYKDQEASEGTEQARHCQFRKPDFAQKQIMGNQYGIAMHTIMQHLCFPKCSGIDTVREEIQRIALQGFITPDLAKLVDPADILNFFNTDVGKQLKSGADCVREFKFSILDDANRYSKATSPDAVLLQGVVDCAMISPDGITVVDFKTDRIEADRIDESIAHYRPQVATYAYALEKIYDLPVTHVYLYYFRLGRLVRIEL